MQKVIIEVQGVKFCVYLFIPSSSLLTAACTVELAVNVLLPTFIRKQS